MKKITILMLAVATIALSFTACSNTSTSTSGKQKSAAPSRSNRGVTGGSQGGGDINNTNSPIRQ